MNRLMRTFPRSACIVPLLKVLPESSIARLSPSALNGLDPSVKRDLPARVTRRFGLTQAASEGGSSNRAQPEVDTDNDGDNDGGFY
ncbi:MAG: hypothetical protein AAFV38_05085 [Pseudomonadota bacterium]